MLEVLGAEAVCKFMHAQLGREFCNYLSSTFKKETENRPLSPPCLLVPCLLLNQPSIALLRAS